MDRRSGNAGRRAALKTHALQTLREFRRQAREFTSANLGPVGIEQRARELTRKFEEFLRGTPEALLEVARKRSLKGEFVLLEGAGEQPPGEASLVLRVDQSERSWRVRLPEGIVADSARVAIALAA